MNRPLVVALVAGLIAVATHSLAGTPVPAPAPSAKPANNSKSDWPDTPVGALARRWTEAFGKGEPAMRACLADVMAPEALAKRGLDARMETYRTNLERFGSLLLVSVDSSGVGAIKVRLAAADFTTHVFTFEAQPKPPHKLLQVSRTESRHTGGHGH